MAKKIRTRTRKNKLSAWGRLRIQAGTAERHGKIEDATRMRAEADRLEAKAKGKPVGPKAASGQDVASALKYIKRYSEDLGLGPGQMVRVFRAGIRQLVNKGLGR